MMIIYYIYFLCFPFLVMFSLLIVFPERERNPIETTDCTCKQQQPPPPHIVNPSLHRGAKILREFAWCVDSNVVVASRSGGIKAVPGGGMIYMTVIVTSQPPQVVLLSSVLALDGDEGW